MSKTKQKIKRLTIHNLDQDDLDRLGILDAEPGWFIKDPNNPGVEWVGEYSIKAEATEAKRGLEIFWKKENK